MRPQTWQEKLATARTQAVADRDAINLLIEVIEEIAEKAGMPHDPDPDIGMA